MKIRIILLEEENISIDYPNTKNILIEDFIKIEDGTCKEIYLKQILEYVDNPAKLVDQCKQKLRKNGKLYIESIDFVEIARGCFLGIIPTKELNEKIIGTKYLHSINDCLQWIGKKITINVKSVDDYAYYIEGTKN